jgi:hypothetical protein
MTMTTHFHDPRLQAFITVSLSVFVILNQIGVFIMSANAFLGSRKVYVKKEALFINDENSNILTKDGFQVVPIEANTSTSLDRFYFGFSLILIIAVISFFVYYLVKGTSPKSSALAKVYSHMKDIRKKQGI